MSSNNLTLFFLDEEEPASADAPSTSGLSGDARDADYWVAEYLAARDRISSRPYTRKYSLFCFE